MLTKQLSVFLENKEGRLGEVLRVLKDNKINIQSLSLADTADYGLLRLIVDQPEVGKENLANASLTPEQKEKTYTGAYSTAYELKGEEGKSISVYGVKLILEDSVRIAVYFQSEEDLTAGYTAWCGTYSSIEIANVGTNLYKVIFDGFMPTSWKTAYTFWLTDGTGVKQTGEFTYSVSTYCMRMLEKVEGGVEVRPVVEAMLALYEAATAYKPEA